MTTPSEKLARTVLANSLCIGCGACASLAGSPFRIEENDFGLLEARQKPGTNLADADTDVLSVCPFSDAAASEDELSRSSFGELPHASGDLGAYISCHTGHVNDDSLRQVGSSGAIGRWVLGRLLEDGLVDHVVHVRAQRLDQGTDSFYSYAIDSDPIEVRGGAKSAYHPVTLVDALDRIRANPGHYAITGVPCFIKAIRLLMAQEPVLAERIRFTVGLICGGMKSKHYSEAIAWEQGIPPQDLVRIDFRKKFPDKPAQFKGNEVESRSGVIRLKSSKDLFVTDYGMGFFKPNACDYCDDVVGELADISIGDAWLPHLVLDPRGTSVIIIRNAQVGQLVAAGIQSGELGIKPLSEKQAVASQSAGFRHRREGLAYRLQKRLDAGQWSPPKRVQPQPMAEGKRRTIYDLREEISRESHIEYLKARSAGRYEVFVRAMRPLVKAYGQAYGRGAAVKLFSKASLVLVAIRSRLARLLHPT